MNEVRVWSIGGPLIVRETQITRRKNLSEYRFAHHKSHAQWYGIEPGSTATRDLRLGAWDGQGNYSSVP